MGLQTSCLLPSNRSPHAIQPYGAANLKANPTLSLLFEPFALPPTTEVARLALLEYSKNATNDRHGQATTTLSFLSAPPVRAQGIRSTREARLGATCRGIMASQSTKSS